MGTRWLYLSSLFIVFFTMSGVLLKLFELPRDIISILLLSRSLKVSSAGQPSNRMCSICARSLGETWSRTAQRVFVCLKNILCILLPRNRQVYQDQGRSESLRRWPCQPVGYQYILVACNCIEVRKVDKSQS